MTRHPDRLLVDEVLSGSTGAWQTLVEQYSGLAFSVARRHLHDHDDARDVAAGVFESLYHGQLERYDGRSALSTWLVLVVRHAAIDHLRHVRGRRRLPAPIQRRPEVEQRVFELFYVQGWPADVALAQLESEGWELSVDTFWDLISDLRHAVDDRFCHRLHYDREAQSRGLPSGRWLEYVEHCRHEQQAHQATTPGQSFTDDESADPVARVQHELARLSEQERLAITMRYQNSLSAREIAGELELRDQRQAFTLLDRAVRKLRRALSGPAPLAVSKPAVSLEGEP